MANTGITITGGEIDLAYQTISPATMCKALPANYVFGELLRQMNTNLNSSPSLPVPFKSNLLTGLLKDLVITSSDSIKIATGSLFHAGDTLFQGTYTVLLGPITYGGQTFNTGDTFPYIPGAIKFTSGILGATIQKILSGFVGAVYNPGDILQAGGSYLVGGNPGTYVLYNSIQYNVGVPFNYKLGFETFTGSDTTSFVQQTAADPQLITNFADFFKSIHSVMGGNCSFGIENGTCFIVNLDYVYRGTIGNLDAGVVDTGIKLQPATDLIPNTIKVGYKDQQYSAINGYSEVNSEQVYKTAIVTPQKELNLVSVYRADPIGIEEIRVSQNDTAASRSDNDIFMVWKNTNPDTSLPTFPFYLPMTIEGLMINPSTTKPMISGVDPSTYNWMLSPKQNLLRGGNFLASLFYNMKGYKITLTAAPKNIGMVTVDSTGRRVAESEPIYISNLPDPLFIPIYATFKPGVHGNPLGMIDSVPYGFISFTYNSRVFKMFADMVSIDIGQNTTQEFKGLLTVDNDITTLIH